MAKIKIQEIHTVGLEECRSRLQQWHTLDPSLVHKIADLMMTGNKSCCDASSSVTPTVVGFKSRSATESPSHGVMSLVQPRLDLTCYATPCGAETCAQVHLSYLANPRT